MADSFAHVISNLLSRSVDLMRKAYHRLFIIAFIQALIIRLVMVLCPFPESMLSGNLNFGMVMTLLGLAIVTVLVGTLGNSLMQACFVAKVKDQPPTMKQVFSFVFHKTSRLFLACVIYYLLMTLGMMLYILPAMFLGTVFFLYLPSLLFEDLSAFGALKRSWKLTLPRFWIIFILYLLTSVLYLLPQLIIQELAFLNISQAILNVLMIFAASFTLPLSNAICVTAYSYRRAEEIGILKPSS